MNYKHGKYSKRQAVLNEKEAFKGSGSPICKKFGCNKPLTPFEFLMGEYCYSHQAEINQEKRAKAKLNDTSYYSYIRYRWNANENKWTEPFTNGITYDQIFKKHSSENFIDEPERYFYRYDLFIDNQCIDSIYKYSPNYFVV